MSSVSSSYDYSSVNGTTSSAGDRMNDLTMVDFIKMMTAELQNQDPTNPMSNSDMLAQIGQIRQITSNDKLTTGIDSLTTGIAEMSASQTMSLASGMIGKTVTGSYTKEATDGKTAEKVAVSGKVDKVSINNGAVKLHIGSSTIDASSVTEFSG